MRILALTNLYPNPFNPHLAPFNRHMFRILGVRNPVRIISPIPWTVEVKAHRNGLPSLPPDRRVELDGLVIDHPRFYFPPKVLQQTYGPLYEASVGQTFRRLTAEFRPEMIYATWAYPDGWAAVRLARRAGLPVVIQVHGSDLLVLTKHPKRKRMTFEALRQADGVVAVSQDLGRKAIAEGVDPDRLRVIYGGIDPAWFYPGPKLDARLRVGLAPDGGPILLFVGNLVKVKGLDVLISACSILAREGRRFQCRIIGQGPLREQLQHQIDQVGLSTQVKLLGPIPQIELPDWYRAADVFVLPSHSEGIPNVLMEASACNLPCVATRVGGIPEISDYGDLRLVPPSAPTALAEAIQEVLGRRNRFVTANRPRTRIEMIDDLMTFLTEVKNRSSTREAAMVRV